MIKMVQLRCQDCGKVIDKSKKYAEENDCDCGGSWAVLNSEDDCYEPFECAHCKRDIRSVGEGEEYTCDECGDEVCDDCMVGFENAQICKQCIDKAYPRKIETKIEYKERIVEKPVKVIVDKEGTPIDTTFNPNNTSRFD